MQPKKAYKKSRHIVTVIKVIDRLIYYLSLHINANDINIVLLTIVQ